MNFWGNGFFTDQAIFCCSLPAQNKSNYFLLRAKEIRYSGYKSIWATLVRSKYSGGWDEYVDKRTYYSVDEINNSAGSFNLKKESVKEAFAFEKAKTDASK
jgi:hypothetical protein